MNALKMIAAIFLSICKWIADLFVVRKTSMHWNYKYERKYKMEIIDPDGWDRLNYYKSWCEEKITWKQFLDRAFRSSQTPKDMKK